MGLFLVPSPSPVLSVITTFRNQQSHCEHLSSPFLIYIDPMQGRGPSPATIFRDAELSPFLERILIDNQLSLFCSSRSSVPHQPVVRKTVSPRSSIGCMRLPDPIFLSHKEVRL